MSDSVFDSLKPYYVFRYVEDKVNGKFTEFEGEVQGFLMAENPWDAVEKLGLEDMNEFGANRIDDLDTFEKAIATERKHLTKISKQLKVMTDERDAEHKKIMTERKCPNCDIQMNEKFQCDKCGFGYEGQQLVDNIEQNIKDQKAKGEDTTELEAFRDQVKSSLGL